MPEMKGSSRTTRLKLHESTLATATGGMAIALATVLSLVTLYKMPQGGSITPASMLPILFCALAFGPAWGLGIGAVYGILQFIIAPYTAHWASIILDYPVAFGLLGLAGLVAAPAARRIQEKNILRRLSLISPPRIIMGVLLGMLGRTVSHLISGVVFYASYAKDAGQNPWLYSLIYNITYMLPEAVITLLVLIPLSLVFRSRRPA